MNTLLHKSIASALALTVIITVGSGETYAQKGKSFRSMFQGKSSGNSSSSKGRGNGPSFNIQSFGQQKTNVLQNKGKSSFLQNNNNQGTFSFKGFGNKTSSKKLKGIQSINSGNLQNVLQNQNKGISGNRFQNLQKNDGLKKLGKGGLQNILGNGNGNQTLGTIPGLNKLGKTDSNTLKGKGIQNWLNNQNHGGNGGKASKLLNLIQHNQQHGKVCIDQKSWCHTKPSKCHWWYNWCKPIAYCDPHHHVHCHWNYVTCDYIVGGRVVVADARWYLGMKGLLLPGQGVGIEEVAPGSPAAAVGLQPGMVITRCNGYELVDETVLGQVIAQSGGVLQMDLLLSADGPPATCVVVMQRVASVNI